MPRKTSTTPTPLEMSILKILWNDQPRTVRQVRDALAIDHEEPRDLVVTSVTTVLNIMVRKKQLTRKKPADGGVFTYLTVSPREETARTTLQSIINAVFNGSASAAVLSLIKTSDIDAEELKSLQRLIDEKLRDREK